MSTLKVSALQNASSANPNITLDTAGNATVGNTLAMGSSFLRNRVINGDMRIDARNAGASVTPTDGQYTLDRWQAGLTQSSKFSVQQSSTAPVGFVNSMLITSLSAYSVVSGDIFAIAQKIEGLNVSDLAWGTANAKTVTLSFQVYSSLTGSFGGSIRNSANNRSYPFSYTVSSANTWTSISVTIPGDTSGTWLTTNGIGLNVSLSLGSGSTYSGTANTWAGANYLQPTGAVSVVGTNGATFYITGVQLEVGSVATPFERLNYQQQLAQCMRYTQIYTGGNNTRFALGGNTESTNGFPTFFLPVTMRAAPTLTVSSVSDFKLVSNTGTAWTATGLGLDQSSANAVTFNVVVGSATSGTGLLAGANSNAKLTLSSEL